MEEFPLHTGKTAKKFPGLRVQITDENPQTNRPLEKGEEPPRLIVYSIELETPVESDWPPSTHMRILPPKAVGVGEEEYVRSVLGNFMARAYRRPAGKEEIDWAVRYFEQARPTVDTFEDAIQEVLALVLTSPKFLYLPEYQSAPADKKVPLTDYELSSRLSYFLWGTMPDEQLRTLAEQGKLLDDKTLAAQVQRMLSDEKSWRFVESFGSQWLALDRLDAVAVNPEFFPNFDNSLKEDMKQESLHFFAEVLYEDLSCLNFLDSDFVVINDRLAAHYGIDKPNSGEFRKVKLTSDAVHGGVLTQASFLLGSSTGAESHPIYRAKWLLDRVLGDPPGDPPADVPELDEESAELKNLSLKEKLEVHRRRASCNRCHRRLDPWGIPFESFNAIGQHSENAPKSGKRKTPAHTIDSDTVLPDGAEVRGSKELRSYLLKNKKQQFAEAFSKHLLTYALGRSLEWTDQPLVDQLALEFQSSGYKMDFLISKIVQSDAFTTN